MICQRCGRNEATVHVLEVRDGKRTSVWICGDCAAGHDESVEPAGNDTLDALLGDLAADAAAAAGASDICPDCATTTSEFRRSNRLGCPGCYAAFHRSLMPVLARFHRHVSHIGRVPPEVRGTNSRLGEIARTRVALEKAVAAEDFEAAASLRDRLRGLEETGGGVAE